MVDYIKSDQSKKEGSEILLGLSSSLENAPYLLTGNREVRLSGSSTGSSNSSCHSSNSSSSSASSAKLSLEKRL